MSVPSPIALPVQSRLIQRFAHPVCVVAAAAAHLAVAAVMLPGRSADFGEGGTALEAIAVDVVDAIPSHATPTLLGNDGGPEEPDRSQSMSKQRHSLPDEVMPATAAQAPSHEADQPTQYAVTAPHTQPPAESTAKADHEIEVSSDATPVAAQVNSVGSIDIVGEAAPGIVAAYGSELFRIVNRGAPKDHEVRHLSKTKLRGTVILALIVTSEAQIEQLEIHQSSGNSQLDEIALSAIRKLALPKPDPRMSRQQRHFGVPIEFR